MHFVGTSNQRIEVSKSLVLNRASAIGISECITENPARVDYTEALRILVQSSAILLMGSSERHYTASKLYPAMLSNRPLLGLFHRASSVTTILSGGHSVAAKLVQFGEGDPPATHIDEITAGLVSLMELNESESRDAIREVHESDFSARRLAGVMAGLFDRVATQHARATP